GMAGALRRDTLTIGVARRLGDAVAIGLAVGMSRVHVGETRRVWAGFVDRGDVLGSPNHDIELALAADDNFSPSAVAGVLVAPPDTHVELAASVAYMRIAHVKGTIASSEASSNAQLDVRQPLTVR